MINLRLRHAILVGLYYLPLSAGNALAQQQDDDESARRTREDSTLSRSQRNGYLGRVSERAMQSGNLDVLGSVSSYSSFFNDRESLKEHISLWHRVSIDSVALDHTPDPDIDDYSPSQGGPTRTSRALAMVQVSVFDALNSIDSEYQPYSDLFSGYENASRHSAVAYATYSSLSALYPQQQQRLDEILDEQIGIIEGFTTDEAIESGRTLGVAVAEAMRTKRLEDGSSHDEPAFSEGGLIADGIFTYQGTLVNGGSIAVGEWAPDPNTPEFSGEDNLSLGAYWGDVEPFFLEDGNQFRVQAPPTLSSDEYLSAYNNVAAIGGASDNTGIVSTSSDDTRFIANYWGYDGVPLIGVPPRVYNQLASQIAAEELDDPLAFARALALVNVGMADAAIAAWDSKYYYNFWRPVTGIRTDDGVEATITDSNWNPVGVSVVNTVEAIRATPPFPAYPSGHATFGAVIFGVLREMFGDDTSFTFVSDEYNGVGVDPFFPDVPRPFVPVRFQTLTEAQQQNGISRVYNGVHWEFDDTAGQELGDDIAQYLMLNTVEFSALDTNTADSIDDTSADDSVDTDNDSEELDDGALDDDGRDNQNQNFNANDNQNRDTDGTRNQG